MFSKPSALHFGPHPVKVVRRAFQKRLRLNIKHNGELVVSTNKTCSQKEILHFLNANQKWIEDSLKNVKALKEKFPQKRFEPGESFLFFGKDHKLEVQQGDNMRAQVRLDQQARVLHVFLGQKQKDIQSVVLNFYKNQGATLLSERLKVLEDLTGLRSSKLSVRGQKRRWGSCATNGHISLNWKLLATPKKCIDYVILHELCHLRHHNHSRDFWQLVESYMPDYKLAKAWLKQNEFALDYLNKNSEIHY